MKTTSEPGPLLLDTHVWLWLVAGSDQLSAEARRLIATTLGTGLLMVAAISLWEIALLASHRRIVLGKPVAPWLEEALAEPAPQVVPLTPQVAVEAYGLPERFHADPADRMIVATARVVDAALMTRDRRILDYAAGGHLTAIAA